MNRALSSAARAAGAIAALLVASAANAAPLEIAPTEATVPPGGSQLFSAGHGSGGYQWAILGSSGHLESSSAPDSVIYRAGFTPNVTEQVQVTDSSGATQVANVTIGPGVSIQGRSGPVVPSSQVTLTATGGSGKGYTWSFVQNNSSGKLDPTTGVYTAGPFGSVPSTPGVDGTRTDRIKVVDSLGNTAYLDILLGQMILVDQGHDAGVAPRGKLSFSANGGNGAPFTWSFSVNASGGSIDAVTGAYVAGVTGNVTDIVFATDPLGNSGGINVHVGPQVRIPYSYNPATAPPRGQISFPVDGGAPPYTWSVASTTGARIDASSGVYTAGAAPHANDVVTVTDSLGNSASYAVSVGDGIALSPTNPSTPPRGKLTFMATGGGGQPYTFTLSTNNSGGNIDFGGYAAGPVGNVSDVVTVTDALGNTAAATITVTAGLSITATPAGPVAPRGKLAFAVAGGSGTGYGWALTTNASGGTIDPSTGVYLAGAIGNVSDVVTATDSLGNTASFTVSVSAGLSVSPAAPPALPPGGEIQFTAAGGSGVYQFSLSSNGSGGTIGSATGTYFAGRTGGVTDVVTVSDSNGNSATVTVSVGPGVSITPAAPSVAPGQADAGRRRRQRQLRLDAQHQQVGRQHRQLGRLRRRLDQQGGRRRHRHRLAGQYGKRQHLGGRRPRHQPGDADSGATRRRELHRQRRQRQRLCLDAREQRLARQHRPVERRLYRGRNRRRRRHGERHRQPRQRGVDCHHRRAWPLDHPGHGQRRAARQAQLLGRRRQRHRL
jgi:hypothetical protein